MTRYLVGAGLSALPRTCYRGIIVPSDVNIVTSLPPPALSFLDELTSPHNTGSVLFGRTSAGNSLW